MTKTIKTNKVLCHFLIGTPNLFTIHTKAFIHLNDVLFIGSLKVLVTEVLITQKSRVHDSFNFYEIRYEAIKTEA